MIPSHAEAEHCVAYVLGELDFASRAEFETHLAFCSACGTEVEELTAILESERDSNLGSAPVRVLVDLLLRQAASRRGWMGELANWWRPAPALGLLSAATLLFSAGYLQGTHHVIPANGRTADSVSALHAAAPLPLPPSFVLELGGPGGELSFARSRLARWQHAALDSAIPDSL